MIRKIITGKLFCRNPRGKAMNIRSSLAWISILPFLCSCTSLRFSGEMQTGRQALLKNQPDVASTYFLHVAETDPNYVIRHGGFQKGVRSHVGVGLVLTRKYFESPPTL